MSPIHCKDTLPLRAVFDWRGPVAKALLLLTILLSAPDAAHAAEILLFGGNARATAGAAKQVARMLEDELPEHRVRTVPDPQALRPNKRAPRVIARAVADSGAAFGVALMSKRRALVILAVDVEGNVVFSQTLRGRRPRVRPAAVEVSRLLAQRLANSASPHEATQTTPGPFATDPNAGQQTDDSKLQEESEPWDAGVEASRDRRHWGASVSLGAGIITFRDTIDTDVSGGDLKIGVGATPLIALSADTVLFEKLAASIDWHRFGVSIGHNVHDNAATGVIEPDIQPDPIDASGWGLELLTGASLPLGPVRGGMRLGLSYDVFSAEEQQERGADGSTRTTALVPSWKRLLLLAGLVADYGELGEEGVTGQFGVVVAPWGSHSEEPVTSGQSPSLLGVRTWLSGRYQLPELFGRLGGAFVGARASLEWLRITYEGNGTRSALGAPVPVADSEESRVGFATMMTAGYLF